ncbi:polyketide synthase dehydratase domain-containing protein, partial [bacterium]|nr:polyketide synthase dehydratase domain-containing protein [bacterium]
MDKKYKNKDIAIIGLSAKLPSANSLDEFWDILVFGKQASSVFSERRRQDIYDYLSYMGREHFPVKDGVFMTIDGMDEFDYKFFNFSPKDASLTDPNQRKFLETAWSALEDAGYMGEKIKNSDSGIYVGTSSDFNSHGRVVNDLFPDYMKNTSPAILDPCIASRIAYILNLKGPNMVIDTACSSALVALFKACEDLRNNQYNIAIAGGVHVGTLHDNLGRRSEIISPEYKTRTFDDSSLGTNWGEGVIAVVLKLLDKAIEDKDNIHAIIKGGAINQDGYSGNLTAPNPQAQAEVLEKAWKDAEVDPETISHIETHGTGTPTGDPIEIDGITRAFKKHTKKQQFCAVGSVKSNIGHLNSVSGMAGVVKSILALKNKKIPPTVNFNFPNRKINFIDSPVFVSDKLVDWDCGINPRRCGVSSFGFSGTNCHIILEEASKIRISKQKEKRDIFTISARSPRVLEEYIEIYLDFIEKNKEIHLNELCYTVNTGREHFEYRVAITIDSVEDLRNKLNKYLNKKKDKEIFYGEIGKRNFIKDKKTDKKYKSGDLKSLAIDYIKGEILNWDKIYKNKRQKISLPTYPFEKIRCWFEIDKNDKKINNHQKELSYPLVHSLLTESMDQDIYQSYLDPSKSELLSEHIVGDNLILVGKASVEMVVNVCVEKFGLGNFIIKNSKHLNPIIFFENEGKKVQIIVKKKEDAFNISIISYLNSNNWVKNFNCEVEVKKVKEDKSLSLKDVLADFKGEKIIRHYQINDHKSLYFSKRWDIVKSINYKVTKKMIDDEILVEIRVKDENIGEAEGYILYPPSLDRTLPIDGVKEILGSNSVYLPESYGQIEIYKKLPTHFYSHVINFREKDSKSLFIFDIYVFDKDGSLVLKMKDCISKKVTRKGDELKENLYYTPKWKEVDNEKDAKDNNIKSSDSNKNILIFKNSSSITEGISKCLVGKRKIEIKLGREYKKINKDKYVVGNNQSDFDRLFKELKKEKINKII